MRTPTECTPAQADYASMYSSRDYTVANVKAPRVSGDSRLSNHQTMWLALVLVVVGVDIAFVWLAARIGIAGRARVTNLLSWNPTTTWEVNHDAFPILTSGVLRIVLAGAARSIAAAIAA